ncbi:MAG TPA: AraC family transcriptional regulator [Pyrinomonadaceae bacterium]|jgi:AraC-like DNA-binding protein|nr:AraC family transcriptional regulator [Pyrinomonadaceae bacterium]
MKLAEIDKDADLLTTVLNALQFKGRCFCYSQFTAPWALKLPESDFAHFHVCERGQAWIEVEGVEQSALMAAGDLVILPHGNAHVLRDDPKSNPIALNQLLKQRSSGTNLVRHGGGGTETIGICGSFKFENEVGNPIISLLPKLIHVPHSDSQTCLWLEPILNGLAREVQNPSVGSGSLINHLTGVMFVQAVRAWIRSRPQTEGGWLGALRDQQISSALNLMHQGSGRPWTIAKLAAEVGMSRSPFATKFTAFVGEPPLTYLTRLRMNLAADYLRNEHLRIGEIAERVGYESQASFTNAFKRQFAMSPREYQEKHRTL